MPRSGQDDRGLSRSRELLDLTGQAQRVEKQQAFAVVDRIRGDLFLPGLARPPVRMRCLPVPEARLQLAHAHDLRASSARGHQLLECGLAANRVEVRVPSRHVATAVPHLDRPAEVLHGFGRLPGEAFAARHVVEEIRLVGAGLEELAAPLRRLRVLPSLVERAHRIPQLRSRTLDRLGQLDPGMTPRVVARLGRRRERRIGERADGDDDQVGVVRLGVEDLRTALGAEVENVLLPVGLVRDARVVVEAPFDAHLAGLVARLHPEGAAGPTLAREAVADGDRKRIIFDFETKLPAVTGGLPGCHRRRTLAMDDA